MDSLLFSPDGKSMLDYSYSDYSESNYGMRVFSYDRASGFQPKHNANHFEPCLNPQKPTLSKEKDAVLIEEVHISWAPDGTLSFVEIMQNTHHCKLPRK
jgi:hypothetical protein